MKYYRVNERGDMSSFSVYDGRKKKWINKGFMLKGQLFTEREYKKMGVIKWACDEIELKKNRVKVYSDGARYERGVWF